MDYDYLQFYKAPLSPRQNISNYQDGAKSFHVCTRFSDGGGEAVVGCQKPVRMNKSDEGP